MKITVRAKNLIKELFDEEHGCIRLISLGEGCCGPIVGMSIEIPRETDEMKIINNVRVAVSPQVTTSLEGLTLDIERNPTKRSRFVLLGVDDCKEE
ncbi:adhesin [Fictibacillus phosphorivorans]|uniref:adhesin n=1 Tax=Fictibacillus phosphorivorans TaxID=1221500 RepID=UPI003CEE04B0